MDPLRCTVIDAVDPRTSVDLDVHAPRGTSAAQLVVPLLAAADLPADRVLRVEGRAIGGLVGAPPLVDGVVLVAGPPGPDHEAPTAVLRWCVVGGPDAGADRPLLPGRLVVGRAPGCGLVVDDPQLSRQHLSLTVTADGVRLHDLGSSNGTKVDGARVPPEGVALRPGQRVGAGATVAVLRLADACPASTVPDGGGRLALRRSGSSLPAPAEVVVRRPLPPEGRDRARIPWAAVVAPVLLCFPMAWFLHQPTYLAFGLLGPLVAVTTSVSDRFGRRRGERHAHAAWVATDADAQQRVQQALDDELALRRARAGDAASLAVAARDPSRLVWRRGADDDDRLELSLGRATVTAQVQVDRGASFERPLLPDAPVTLRLDDVGHVTLVGDAASVAASARWLVGQLAVLTTPGGARIGVVGWPECAWARWLPHRIDVAPAVVEHEVRRRVTTGGDHPSWVVVVAEAHDDPAWSVVLASGAAVGVHLLWCAAEGGTVPPGCGAVVRLPFRGPARLELGGRPAVDDLVPDGVGPAWAEQVARSLAPLREPGRGDGATALPPRSHLLPLLELGPEPAESLRARWSRRPRSTTAVLGSGVAGPVSIDLVHDGPHALVAGTTGSGKSELLQTLVASLAAANRPDELAFVLVDYKGGAAFRDCAALPHVSGLVTDLDDQLAARALASLQAELTRRERLLHAVGASDLESYQLRRDGDRALEPLGRLVIAVDEFRLLAVDLPEFLDGLVRLAAVGRSLGVHLVLATQRPAGIVSADIRANVNLRICLRVRDRSDSHDVIDSPDAALLPEGLPGRALLRTGPGDLVPVQVALSTGPSPAPPPQHVVVVRPGEPAVGVVGPDQLVTLAAAATAAADALGARPAPSPWLLPLPDVLPLDALRADHGRTTVGRLDRPDDGRQPPLTWDVRTGSHLAVSGTARTGRTTALLTFVLAALAADPGCAVHAVDPTSGPLGRALDGLPQVGTVVQGDRPRAVRRLVQRLRETAGEPRPSSTLLVVDGWDALVQQLDRVDHGQGVDELLALARDAEPTGLRLVVAGGRAVLTSRLAGLVPEKLLLRCADPTDLLLAGAPIASSPGDQPPGRAVHLPTGDAAQLAWPGGPDEVRARLAALPVPASPRLRLRPLPDQVSAAALHERSVRSGPTSEVLLGLGGDDAAPVGLDVHGIAVVAGPNGSGRTTALEVVAEQLVAAGRSVLVAAARNSRLVGDDRWPTSTADDPTLLGQHPHAVLLVDDADLLGSRLVEAALATGRTVVASTTTAHLAGSFTGWPAALRRTRTGLLLLPGSAHDGEPFGIRAEPPDVRTPGRGQLVVRGRAVDVQVAMPAARASQTVGTLG
ncbi:FtsK/SpoIIIE domain-containing protein [Angustibacter peucedani]